MRRMKLGTKLIVGFLLVGLIPFALIGGISLYKSSRALSLAAFNQLQAVRGIKKAQIENFFQERQGDMGVLVETVGALRREAFNKLEAIQEIKKAQLQAYFKSLEAQLKILKDDDYVMTALDDFTHAYATEGRRVSGPQWEAAAARYDGRMQDIVKDNGWYDVFLISSEGAIVYTASREADLGMTITESALKDQGIGKALQKSRSMGNDDIALADLAPYSPSGGAPAGFMMARMVDSAGRLKGYAALQIPLDQINRIMLLRNGMGKTGESYLVGQDGLMRSDSFLDPDGHSVKASFQNNTRVETRAVQEALAGNDGQKVINDYNGNPVLSCWDAVDLGSGVRWAMMSEIDVAEAFSPVDANGKAFYAKYIEMYGYYDLFLVNPDGFVFYTVTKEADYQTNLVSGKFADSNLGGLVRQVMTSRKFGLADFAAYAPSNNDPCAFIAQPIVHDGEVEIVVALQLSLEAINHVMQQREGMGETGETYLVGSDKLMRSDSYLDPKNHSVSGSFANPAAGSVDTTATREALAGKTDRKIITDYNGNYVLSAYAPLSVGGTTWALIAEIDKSEAFAAVAAIEWLLALIGIVGAGIIAAVAFFIARSITKPINRVIDGLHEGSEQVTSASGQVSSASQSLAEGASEQAASIEETASSLEEMSSMTKQNAENAKQADQLMKESNQVVTKADASMSELTRSMDDISKASEETSKIIKTIDEIAFQTNLLALNAAVEAARAGEAGAGFAVVADEVRNLAMRAAEAAKNTSELIEGTVKKIEGGTGLVASTNAAFGEVAKSAVKVGELVAEIAAASDEQAQGIEQVNTAVSQMDSVTQQNAANAEESASASEELNAQANQMMTYVNDLVDLVGGSRNSVNGGFGFQMTGATDKKIITHKSGKDKSVSAVLPGGGKTSADADHKALQDADFSDF